MPTDLEIIDELHRADMLASRQRDFGTLRSLLSNDAVLLPPGGRMIRGRSALDESFAAMSNARTTTEILDYRFEWHEVQVCGDYAFEWGYLHGSERNLDRGTTSSERYHVMRILQRQDDGTWKVHRSIWNVPAP